MDQPKSVATSQTQQINVTPWAHLMDRTICPFRFCLPCRWLYLFMWLIVEPTATNFVSAALWRKGAVLLYSTRSPKSLCAVVYSLIAYPWWRMCSISWVQNYVTAHNTDTEPSLNHWRKLSHEIGNVFTIPEMRYKKIYFWSSPSAVQFPPGLWYIADQGTSLE